MTAAGTRRSEPAIREVRGPPGPFLIPAKWIAVLTSCEQALHIRLHSGASRSRAQNQVTRELLWLGAEHCTGSLSPSKEAVFLRCCSEAPLHLSVPHCFPPSARPCPPWPESRSSDSSEPSWPTGTTPETSTASMGGPRTILRVPHWHHFERDLFQEAMTALAPLVVDSNRFLWNSGGQEAVSGDACQ